MVRAAVRQTLREPHRRRPLRSLRSDRLGQHLPARAGGAPARPSSVDPRADGPIFSTRVGRGKYKGEAPDENVFVLRPGPPRGVLRGK